MTGVRYRDDTGFEGRCDTCREYWPLTAEFWVFGRGFRTCRGCYNERSNGYDRRRARLPSPETRARDAARKRAERRDPERRPAILARDAERARRNYHAAPVAARARVRADYERRVGHPPTPGVGRPRMPA